MSATSTQSASASRHGPGFEYEQVHGGVLVFEPRYAPVEGVGRPQRVGQRLVGVAAVRDRDALRDALAARGIGPGVLERLPRMEVGR